MKMLLTLVLLAFGVVQADTIDLYTTAGSGCLHQYHNIDTSLGLATATIYAPQLAGSVGGMSLSVVGNDEWFTGTFYGSGIPAVLTGSISGNQITIIFTETWYRVLAGAGRARWWCYKWTLQAGLITR